MLQLTPVMRACNHHWSREYLANDIQGYLYNLLAPIQHATAGEAIETVVNLGQIAVFVVEVENGAS